jgi:phosphatidate phosphatase APP1
MQRGARQHPARAVVVEVRDVAALHDDTEHGSTRGDEVDDLTAGLVALVVRVVGG